MLVLHSLVCTPGGALELLCLQQVLGTLQTQQSADPSRICVNSYL